MFMSQNSTCIQNNSTMKFFFKIQQLFTRKVRLLIFIKRKHVTIYFVIRSSFLTRIPTIGTQEMSVRKKSANYGER